MASFLEGLVGGFGQGLGEGILKKLKAHQQSNNQNKQARKFVVPQEAMKNPVFGNFMGNLPKEISEIEMTEPPQEKDTLGKIMNAIGTVESNNRYNIKGVKTKYGRPLGKYQILETNLPTWSTDAIGREVSKKEFLNNPELQEKIARHRMKRYYDKYQTPEDVAAMWYSGKPYRQSKDIVDPYLNQSVKQYVNKVGRYL